MCNNNLQIGEITYYKIIGSAKTTVTYGKNAEGRLPARSVTIISLLNILYYKF